MSPVLQEFLWVTYGVSVPYCVSGVPCEYILVFRVFVVGDLWCFKCVATVLDGAPKVPSGALWVLSGGHWNTSR